MTDTAVAVRIGVIGGGRMGAGIAQSFAALGSDVTVVESGDLAAARQRIRNGLSAAADRNALGGSDIDTIMGRITLAAAIAELPADSDLVIEAVPETPRLKAEVLTAAERAVGPDTVLASNTSSLSITELGAVLKDPSRFLGMHFFNPVPASKLVEVVRAPATAPGVTERVRGWVAALGKAEVLVNDAPGFATSRLGVCLGLEAVRMLEDGVADAESIDRAMELGYRHALGPLRSTDLVGLDVRLAIAEHLAATLGPRFEPPQLLRDKVARGELGRKTGRGFYDWNGGTKGTTR
ncbi:3-hydroxyacyl-CoA dehydrogenase family protein [Nocardia sp. NPDC004860]|uniref:3-hydroxyacyl-CoA dehydrogenase family protein n=1 Tax=Nocardia sp. NPDC004860 TaxID=3154557 RepID=UPI0033A0DE8F